MKMKTNWQQLSVMSTSYTSDTKMYPANACKYVHVKLEAGAKNGPE
jgi:hypothetical protein